MKHRKLNTDRESTPLSDQLVLPIFGDSTETDREPENRSTNHRGRGGFPGWMGHVRRTNEGGNQG
jgi:hypothetical protein